MEDYPLMLAPQLAQATLAILLASACWHDVRSRRIPNRLVLAGVLAGLALNTLAPEGFGLFAAHHPGGIGFVYGLGGFFTGIAMLLPLYLLGGMGAGDVKLMGMVGAFLGPWSAIGASLITLVSGGMLATAVAIRNGTLRCAVENIRFMLLDSMARGMCGQSARLPQPGTGAGKVPYALAIALGTFVHVLILSHGRAIVG